MKPFLSGSCNGGDRDVGEGERAREGGVGMKDGEGRGEREEVRGRDSGRRRLGSGTAAETIDVK